jgi:hypothetical protein
LENYIISTIYDGKLRKLFLENCKQCSNKFYKPKHSSRVFCNKTCYIEYKTKNRIKHELICSGCGISFIKKKLNPCKTGLRFCTRKCKDNSQRLENLGAILRPAKKGILGQYGYRQIARRNYPNLCNRCGYKEHIGILRVHHKDRDRKNNDVSNLEILCPNCHEVEHLLSGDGLYTGNKTKYGDIV